MCRKIIAVVLVLSLAVLFAACKGNDNKPSLPSFSFDPGTSFSGGDSSTDPSDSPVSAPTGNENTVILTTTPGQTMQTVPTTRFTPEPVTTTQPSSVDPNVPLTVPTMTAPTVYTSNNPGGVTYVPVSPTLPTNPTRYNPYLTTQPTVNPYLTTTRYNPPSTLPTSATIPTVTQSTTKPTTTQPTSSATRRAKTVVINDIATTSDKKMVVTIDSNGWDGSFQNNSQNISVKVDGVAKSAPCSVRSGSKNADGYQYITIDLSELSVPEGSNVQFTVPSAFLQTSSGSQYNNAFSGAYTMM